MKGNRAMANALESACQPQEYSSRADTQVSQHAEQVPDLDKASTAGPMLATIAKGDDNDGISLSPSVLDLSANESLENHRDDKVTSLEHHGNGSAQVQLTAYSLLRPAHRQLLRLSRSTTQQTVRTS